MPQNTPRSKEKVLESLPKKLHPIFEQFVSEYRYHCVERYGKPFVSYVVIADLIKNGWRPTHKPFIEY